MQSDTVYRMLLWYKSSSDDNYNWLSSESSCTIGCKNWATSYNFQIKFVPIPIIYINPTYRTLIVMTAAKYDSLYCCINNRYWYKFDVNFVWLSTRAANSTNSFVLWCINKLNIYFSIYKMPVRVQKPLQI